MILDTCFAFMYLLHFFYYVGLYWLYNKSILIYYLCLRLKKMSLDETSKKKVWTITIFSNVLKTFDRASFCYRLPATVMLCDFTPFVSRSFSSNHRYRAAKSQCFWLCRSCYIDQKTD